MKTQKTTNPAQVRERRVRKQKNISIDSNNIISLYSCQAIPTNSDLVGKSDEELELLANFIPAQEADQ